MNHFIHSFVVVVEQGGEVVNTFLAGTISKPAQQAPSRVPCVARHP